jgi:hypothetical protein
MQQCTDFVLAHLTNYELCGWERGSDSECAFALPVANSFTCSMGYHYVGVRLAIGQREC